MGRLLFSTHFSFDQQTQPMASDMAEAIIAQAAEMASKERGARSCLVEFLIKTVQYPNYKTKQLKFSQSEYFQIFERSIIANGLEIVVQDAAKKKEAVEMALDKLTCGVERFRQLHPTRQMILQVTLDGSPPDAINQDLLRVEFMPFNEGDPFFQKTQPTNVIQALKNVLRNI
jgi:hypothetical protein